MKKILALTMAALVVMASVSPLASGQVGPAVKGYYDGTTYVSNIPFVSGAGLGAVIATTQSVTAALGNYLPLTGGTVTGNSGVVTSTGGPAFTVSKNSITGPTFVSSTSSSAGSALSTILAQGTSASGGPAIGFTNTTNSANQKTWDIYENPASLDFRTSDDANSQNATWLSAARSGYAITGITSNSGSGSWIHTGSLGVTGNVNVQGTLSSTSNLQPASPTNTGVAIGGGPNYSIATFSDQTQTLDNRNSQEIFFLGSHTFRFAKDDGSAATAWLIGTGGYAKGITGITSNSGSGAWAHTGPSSATGTISTAFPSGNNMVLSGAANGATPSLMTSGSNVNVSMNIGTQGGGGINLLSATAVTGNLTATGNITATGTGTMPVYGNTGTAFTAQHMTVGYQALTGGTATVTFSGAGAFTNATSYLCTATSSSGSGGVMAAPQSGTSLTLSGTGTDVIAYQCIGN
jgi:hypothetical protein